MKSFRRIKKINQQEYVYEIQPYYDPKTKKTKQKSKYIGKYAGDIENAQPVRKIIPKSSYSWGEFIPFQEVIRQLKLYEILESVLGRRDAETLIGISINKAIESMPMYAIKSWAEGTILIKEYPEMILTSQTMSEFLKRISNESVINKITEKIIEKHRPKGTFIYDLTSITSYSEFINILEYGYNRNEDGLAQINYSIAISEEKNIPIMFDIYSGSIVDVSTLRQTIKKLKIYGVKDCTLILDRGLFSEANIDELLQKENPINFIMPGTLSNKEIRKIIETEEIEKLENLHKYQNKTIFAKAVKVKIGKHQIEGYLYYNSERANKEKEHLYNKISELKEKIEDKISNLTSKDEIEQKIEVIAKAYKKYFTWNDVKRRLEYQESEIEKSKITMGKFILLYTGNKYKWDECLENYKKKSDVEQAFDMLKNDMNASRLNMKTEETFKGLLFVYFISLMLRMKFNSIVSKNNLHKKYSFTEMMLELRKLKKIQFDNGEILTTELTKKHKEILQHFNFKF